LFKTKEEKKFQKQKEERKQQAALD